MIRAACHFVPSILLGSLLAGCYVAHGLELDASGRADAGRRDAGRRDAYVPPIAASPLDAGLPPSCSPRPLDIACTDTETSFVPTNVPYDLPVYFGDGEGGCFCGETLACRASVDANIIALDTAICAEALCDACFPYVQGHCRLPPLAEGDYRVRVNGVEAFPLAVSDAQPAIGPVDQCRRPPDDPHGCGNQADPHALIPDEACHPNEAIAGLPIPITLRNFCFPCGSLWGPCQVIRTARTVRVIPWATTSSCDIDCIPGCFEGGTSCAIPPLEPGEYSLSVDGLPGTSRLLVSDGGITRPGQSCLSVPED
ncbi:MAG: hypothetical protein IT378_15315 [Sandaracinaceae bacterium]|nr:hypothetical protein [Sandaracinaceae bacterium]